VKTVVDLWLSEEIFRYSHIIYSGICWKRETMILDKNNIK